MKAYLVVTSMVFGLLTLAHVWRAYVESVDLLHDPWFVLTTVLSAALCAWGWRLVVATRRAGAPGA